MSEQPNALKLIDPKDDPHFLALGAEADALAVALKGAVVTDDTTEKAANELLTAAKGVARKLEERRTSVTKPVNDFLRTFNAAFAKHGDLLEQQDKALRGRLGAYIKKKHDAAEAIRRQREAEAEAARREQERLEREAAEKPAEADPFEEITAQKEAERLARLAAAPAPAPPKTQYVEGGGSVSTPMEWVARIVDASLVPEDYLKPPIERVDIGKIRAAVKSGVRKIPGVVIEEQPKVTVRG